MKLRALVLCLALCAGTWSAGEDDIVDLPGLQFVVNFKTYSGYLNANDKGNWQMHYIDWDRIKIVCRTGAETDVEKYDFTQFMTSQNGMDFYGDNSSECGRLIAPLISRDGFFGYDYDSYNYYQDCYQSTYNIPTNARLTSRLSRRRRATSDAYVFDGTSNMGNNAAVKLTLY
ncbi:hypothetical protein TELCIR_08874 [Teladorsagia circumcincta]|uniref:Uncharacterized protein n=1 Tax=Teladorsagia circumcincta TaxID=45464 RepID=A0A2G9UGC1_TELCI|nr:hypothetical protein TELCIR_08874 [Teladorsagia circumcincta]